MSYGVFRPPPHLRRPAPPRQRLPLGALSAPPQTVNLGLLSATGALQATTVAQTTYLGPLSATAALLTATDSTTGGGQTENLGLLSAASALRNTQVNQTTYLGALSATAAALTPTVTPGAVSQNLALQSAASALGNTTVTPGGVSVPLGLQTATSSLLNATATTSTIVNLGTLSLAAELKTANVAILVVFSVAANADDGYLDGGGSPYASVAYSASYMDNIEAYVYRTFSGGNYFIGNALFRFDTSSLGSGSTVLNATLQLGISRDNDGDSRSLTFDWHTWTPTPGASNWTATAGTNAHAGTAISTFTSSGSAIYELALSNVSNVNKTGYTGLRGHLSGGQPTGNNQVGIATLENTTYDEPRLLVTYIPGTPGVTENLAALSATAAMPAPTVTGGPTSTPLSLQTATGALQSATATTATTVNLGVLSATGALQATQIQYSITVVAAAGADDGYVYGQGAGYPPSYSSFVANGATLQLLKSFAANFTVSNVLARFDTASLPDDAQVQSATLTLYKSSTASLNADSRSVTADYHTWTPTMGSGNYTSTVGTNAHSGTPIANLSATTDAAHTFALENLSNISKTGYTGLRLHISGGQPTGGNQVHWHAYENGNSALRPKITVYYTVGLTENLSPLNATGAMPAPTVTPGPTTTNLPLQTATAALRTATVTPGPVVLQLLTKPLQAGDTTYTVDQLKFRTLDELQSDNTSLAAALRNTTVTTGPFVQLGLLSATGALRNTTVTPGPTSTPLSLQTLAAALQSATVQSITNVPLGLLSAAVALRNTTVTIGGVTTPLETQALALVLRDLDTGLGVTPTVILALQSVPEATLLLETVASATVVLESVPSATVGVETGPTAQIDDEDVPTATVALAP